MTTTFESTIRQIMAPQETVYATLSNLENLEKVRDRIPQDKVSRFSFDRDHVSVSVPPIGSVTMVVVDRDEPKTIKFAADQSPVPFNFWIQLLPVNAASCKMKLTIKADVNPLIKSMVKRPLEEGIEKIADALQSYDYLSDATAGSTPAVE